MGNIFCVRSILSLVISQDISKNVAHVELMCSGRVSSSCSTSGSSRVNLVKYPEISHEWGKDQKVVIRRRKLMDTHIHL